MEKDSQQFKLEPTETETPKPKLKDLFSEYDKSLRLVTELTSELEKAKRAKSDAIKTIAEHYGKRFDRNGKKLQVSVRKDMYFFRGETETEAIVV